MRMMCGGFFATAERLKKSDIAQAIKAQDLVSNFMAVCFCKMMPSGIGNTASFSFLRNLRESEFLAIAVLGFGTGRFRLIFSCARKLACGQEKASLTCEQDYV